MDSEQSSVADTLLCGRKSVLVADESQSSRDLLRFILERSGCIVLEASDSNQAIDIASSKSPDLLIVDLNMPGREGRSAASELRNTPQFARTPMIAISGATGETTDDIAQAGALLFLPKPVRPERLRACVASLLSR